MPLFMDIHFATGASAKEIAVVHQLDVDLQDKYGCKMMTYWFDENRGFVFCLVECADKNSLMELHRNSHRQEPNKIIQVDSKLIELFLGRIRDPEKLETENELEKFINETALRTLMLIELRYYNQPAEITNPFIKTFNNIVKDALKDFNGSEVNRNGGEIMASFTSAENAVKSAFKIQKAFIEHKRKNHKNNFDLAIGLSIGSPVDEHEDFFGDTILLCKRLCQIAGNGSIILSSEFSSVYEKDTENLSNKFVRILNSSEEGFLNKLMELTEQIWNDENYNVDIFSKKIGLSKSQLYRKITSLTGLSPNEFVREYRLKKAVNMLERKKGNISQIAFETGFNNASYFSKCFQKKFGMLPSDYYRHLA